MELKNTALTDAISNSSKDGVFNYKAFRKNIDKLGNSGLFKDEAELEAFRGLAKLTESLKQPLKNNDFDTLKLMGIGGVTGEPLSTASGAYLASWLVSRPAVNKSLVKLANAKNPVAVNAAVQEVTKKAKLYSKIAPKNRNKELYKLGTTALTPAFYTPSQLVKLKQ